jgi:hypothetical protein
MIPEGRGGATRTRITCGLVTFSRAASNLVTFARYDENSAVIAYLPT